MKFKVVLVRSDEGVSVSCPGLPGCWSQGETEQEALANIAEAVREYLAAIDDTLPGRDVREVEVAVQGAAIAAGLSTSARGSFLATPGMAAHT